MVKISPMKKLLCIIGLCLCIGSLLTPAFAADHPWQINSPDKDASIAFGFLAQGQVENIRTTTGTSDSQDIFLRRLRFITAGQFSKKLSFFIETDSPNLGKGTALGTKAADSIYLQDAFLTYTFRPEFQIDAGMLLPSFSHNSLQSAASLMPVDYGPYTFLASDPTNSRVGRDYGIQARGYLFKKHFEYRFGVFQGNRSKLESNPGTSNDFRYAARVVWYPFDAETGYFYSGTTLGAKKILAIGAGFDHQLKYNATSVDIFYDQPVNKGDSITLQADYNRFDGGLTFPQLPRENVWMVEAGYYSHKAKIGPFAQLSNRLFTDPKRSDLKKYTGGIAYYPSGAHRFNLKFGVGRTLGTVAAESWQVVFQGQTFFF
jgi:hypothetical protein